MIMEGEMDKKNEGTWKERGIREGETAAAAAVVVVVVVAAAAVVAVV
jgi:hypothetical protein